MHYGVCSSASQKPLNSCGKTLNYGGKTGAVCLIIIIIIIQVKEAINRPTHTFKILLNLIEVSGNLRAFKTLKENEAFGEALSVETAKSTI